MFRKITPKQHAEHLPTMQTQRDAFCASTRLDTAVKYGLDTSFGFIQTVCAIIGTVTVTSAAKRAMYPQARPVEPLFNRLRMEGGPLPPTSQHVWFSTDPYKLLRHNRKPSCRSEAIVVLQGESQSGKTMLLRTAIPWSRRWTIWPLSWICWRGLYMNGGEAHRQDSFGQHAGFVFFLGLCRNTG
eukprot:s5416_g3.t1